MKRILAAGTAMLLAMGTAANAEPIITIDDFNMVQSVSDTTANGTAASGAMTYTIGGNTFTRTVTVNQIEHATANPNAESRAAIGFGELVLSNDSQTNSNIRLEYNIDSLINDLEGATDLMMEVIFADVSVGTGFTIAAFLNGTFLKSETFTGPGDFEVALPALNADGGNTLRLDFSGGTSFDATLGPISVNVREGDEIPVPEPGALGLLGLGLVSVAFARRRKAAA